MTNSHPRNLTPGSLVFPKPSTCPRSCTCYLEDSGSPHRFALLFTCRYVYDRAIKMVYGSNIFCFSWYSGLPWAPPTPLKRFLHASTPLLMSCIRTLYLRPFVHRWEERKWGTTLDDLYIHEEWEKIIRGDESGSFKGFSALTGLQVLALEFHVLTTCSPTLEEMDAETLRDDMVPLRQVLGGFEASRMSELHVSVWEKHRAGRPLLIGRRVILAPWTRDHGALEKSIRAALLGSSDVA